MRKDNGLVRDVFQQRHMLQLRGNIGIGHVRYPTAGRDGRPRRSRSTSTRRTASASRTTAT